MKLHDTIPYDQVQFRWVSNHYDIHWEGYCIHPTIGLSKFITKDLTSYEDHYCYRCDGELESAECDCPDSYSDVVCDIYKLNLLEKIKARYDMWLFEVCVGEHWSYPQRKNGVKFKKSSRSMSFRAYYWWIR